MSSLEAAITLDDVFAVVAAKRVPLAAELAGYLALEIADGTDAGSGEVDPKTVFISEEGTVALVRPKKASTSGDAEASVRQLLVRLLDASGSSTPALGVAAKRKPGNGLPALVEELEAALIPVNRAAGRRALARLSREVKRVTQGVGRNASAAPLPPPAAAKPVSVPPPAEVVKPDPKPEPKPEEPIRAEPPPPSQPAPQQGGRGAPQAPLHDPLAPTPIAPKPKPTSIPPPPVKGAASGPPPPPARSERPPGPPSALGLQEALPPPEPSPAPGARVKNDAVDELLGSFGVSSGAEDKQLARDLKAMAGLAPTPSAPDARTLAELAEGVGRGPLPSQQGRGEDDSVAALLALADASLPAPAVTANQALPPVNSGEPASPIIGGSPQPGAAAGAPAILRNSTPQHGGRDAPQTPPPSSPDPKKVEEPKKKTTDPKREVFKRTSPTDAAESSAATQKRRAFEDPPRAPRTSMGLLVFALIALGAATIALYKYAPHVFVGHKPVAPITPAIPSAGTPGPGNTCRLALVVNDVPANAEVLLRVGQAPVDVDQMPVGARLELVATAEGYAPRRAVIPPESVWDKGSDGKPRIDVPIQLDPSKAKPGTLDPWPAAEPGSGVGGSGASGTVHVVSSVRGAEVWLLAGLGPKPARIEQKCDGDVDVLIAGTSEKLEKGASPLRKRIHVSDKQIAVAAADAKGNKTVTISAVTGP